MNCHFSVTFIKSLNQGSIKPCLKKYVSVRNANSLKLSSLTDKCIFCFVLSLLISRVAKVKYRNDSILTPGCVFTFVTSEVAAYLKGSAYLFLEKMQMVVFVLEL